MKQDTKTLIHASNEAHAALADCQQRELLELERLQKSPSPKSDAYAMACRYVTHATRNYEEKRLAALIAVARETAPELR